MLFQVALFKEIETVLRNKKIFLTVNMFSGNKRSLDTSMYGNALRGLAMEEAKEVPADFNIGIFELENGKQRDGPVYLPINYFHIFDHE